MRRLRNGGGLGRERLQDVDAELAHPLAQPAPHAPPDDRRDVRGGNRFERRLFRLDATAAQRSGDPPPRRALSSEPDSPVPVPAANATPAAWVVDGVRDFDYTVGSIVPVGFEAYARVFHPARRREESELVEVGWGDVARDYGRVMHPLAEWGSLTSSWRDPDRARIWDEEPDTGRLPGRLARTLAEVLGRHTQTPEHCHFAVWEGWGGISERLSGAARFTLPQRPMLLLRGPASAAVCALDGWNQSANLWWPDDRAWCVGSEVDLMTTYIGGSVACIRAILADDRLEALPASVDQRVTWDSDTLNPQPWE